MVVGKVGETLESVGGVRMEGDTILGSTVEVFESVDGRLVMLMVRCHVVRREEGKGGANVRACTCGQPIYATNDALVYLRATLEIRIIWIRIWNGVNRISRSIWCHIWSAVHFVNTKAMGCIFGESGLAKMDGEMAIIMFGPGKCSSVPRK